MIAGVGFSSIWRLNRRWYQVAVVLVLFVGLGVQIRSTALLNGIQHSDPRSPLAYAPTSANIERLPEFLNQQLHDLPESVEVCCVWFLYLADSWYLRKFTNVTYDVNTPEFPSEAVFFPDRYLV